MCLQVSQFGKSVLQPLKQPPNIAVVADGEIRQEEGNFDSRDPGMIAGRLETDGQQDEANTHLQPDIDSKPTDSSLKPLHMEAMQEEVKPDLLPKHKANIENGCGDKNSNALLDPKQIQDQEDVQSVIDEDNCSMRPKPLRLQQLKITANMPIELESNRISTCKDNNQSNVKARSRWSELEEKALREGVSR